MAVDSARATGYPAYAKFIAEQITREDARKTSLQARGAAVVATSGGIATLLLGLAALTTKEDRTFTLTQDAGGPLQGALLAFFLATLCSVYTQMPRVYKDASPAGLREIVDDESRWNDTTEAEAEKKIARNRLVSLEQAKKLNGGIANAVFFAIVFQSIGVGLLALSMYRLF